MKKFLSLILTVIAVMNLMAVSAFAKDAAETKVRVTITNGDIVMNETVTVSDVDQDGSLTIYDALYCAHEDKYSGGAEAGFEAAESEWGLSISKLWGVENGGSYGYYLNNASAWSLVDPVADGDKLVAFVYVDPYWSDMYCYFDQESITMTAGESVTLTLMGAGYDENWNPVEVPVSGATITIDGAATSHVTDDNGKVTLTVNEAKTAVISAVGAEGTVLVPPAAQLTVNKAPVNVTVYVLIALAVVAVVAIVIVLAKKAKKNAK